MSNDKIGTGYYEIYADLTKIKSQLAQFQSSMRSKKLDLGLSSTNSELSNLNNKLKKVGTTATKSFKDSVKSALSLERVLNRLAFIGTVGVVFAIGNALKSSIGDGIDAAQELELQMSHVFTVMDKGESTLERFKESVKGISVEYVQKMKEVSSSLYDIISARIGEENAINVLAASAKLATANMAEMRDVTNTVISILNSYKIAGTEVNNVTDMLQKTIIVGKMEMSDFASTLGKIIPQAAAYNIKLSEMFGVLATMTNQGMKAREAVTSMNRAITAWSQNAELSNILQQNGIKGIVDALSLMDIQQQKTLSGGVRGVKALNAFLNDYATTLNNIRDISNNAGASNEALLKQSNTLSYEINKKTEKMAMLWEEIGELLLPIKSVIIDILYAVSDLLGSIIKIPKKIGEISGEIYLWLNNVKEVKETNKYIIAYERKMLELAKEKNKQNEIGAILAEDEFTRNRLLAKQWNDILNSVNSEINILKKKKSIQVAYGKDVIDIDKKILEAYEKKLFALNRLIKLGNNYSDVLDDVYDTQLEIANLSITGFRFFDELLATDFGKFEYELQNFLDNVDTGTITVKDFFDALIKGGEVSIAGAKFNISNYLADNKDLAKKLKNSKNEYNKFYNWLATKNEVLAKWFKRVIKPPAPDLTDFDKYMESLSTAFQDNNEIKEFVKYMEELDKLLGAEHDESLLIKFMNGEKLSSDAKQKLDDLGISLADLKAKLQELGIPLAAFNKIFYDSEMADEILLFYNDIIELIDGMADSFTDFVSNEAAEWARLVGEGKDATKAFYDFFDRLMTQLLVDFTKMISQMILELARLEIAKAITAGFGNSISEVIAEGMSGGNMAMGTQPTNNGIVDVSDIAMPDLTLAFNPDLIKNDISYPKGFLNSVNRLPEITTQNNITINPIINAKFDRRSAGWVVDEGNKFNNMGSL